MNAHALSTLAVALLLAPSPSAPRPEPPALRGVVVDETGAPLEGARCWISGFEERDGDGWRLVHRTGLPRVAFTDADGAFELEAPAGLRCDVDFDADGRAPAFVRAVEPGEPLRVALAVGRTVSGSVVLRDGDREEPVPHAKVALERSSARGLWFEHAVLADEHGRFELPGKLPEAPDDETWSLVFGGARLALDPGDAGELHDVRIEVRMARGGD